jgi:hypothetical protein
MNARPSHLADPTLFDLAGLMRMTPDDAAASIAENASDFSQIPPRLRDQD